MAFRWRADDGPTLNSGLVALLFSRNPQFIIKGFVVILLAYEIMGFLDWRDQVFPLFIIVIITIEILPESMIYEAKVIC